MFCKAIYPLLTDWLTFTLYCIVKRHFTVKLKSSSKQRLNLFCRFTIEKEKTYDGGDRIDRITGWSAAGRNYFSMVSLFGIQFPYEVSLKFKYYLSEFHNHDYTNNAGVKPYAGLKSNIYYSRLAFFFSET